MALDPKLLEILACPDDKGPLLYFADEDTLYNPRLKRRYRVLDGDIPGCTANHEVRHKKCSPTAMAASISSIKTDSSGAWLMPPGLLRKSMADGMCGATIIASCPAPLVM